MQIRLPQTVTHNVTEKINALTGSSRYLVSHDFAVAAVRRDCEQLMKADAASAYLLLGFLAHVCGDLPGVEANLAKAEKLNMAATEVANVRALAYVNLGLTSRALNVIAPWLTKGRFNAYWELALSTLGFRTVLEAYRENVSRSVEIDQEFPVQMLVGIEAVMIESGLADKDIASLTELAGEVMRRRRLFCIFGPQLAVRKAADPGGAMIHIRYRLGITSREVAEANLELADLVGEREIAVPDELIVTFMVA